MFTNLEIPIQVVPVPPLPLAVYNNVYKLLKANKVVYNLKVNVNTFSMKDNLGIANNNLALIGISFNADAYQTFQDIIQKSNCLVNVLICQNGNETKDIKIIKEATKDVIFTLLEQVVKDIMDKLQNIMTDGEKINAITSINQIEFNQELRKGSPSHTNLPVPVHLQIPAASPAPSGISGFFNTADKKSQKRKEARLLKLQGDINGLMGKYHLAIAK